MAATLAEQLENVQAAIATAESAQSMSDSGQSRQMADINALYARETRLLNRINLAAKGSRRLAEF
jgi:signal transduction histidine kinase